MTNNIEQRVYKEAIKSYIDDGCIDYTKKFGFIAIPEGYSILLNADLTHFFWLRHEDCQESVIFACRFHCLRSAKHNKTLRVL